jgi:hypothetical protein
MSYFIITQFCLTKKSKNRIFQNFILIAKPVAFSGENWGFS